MAVYIGNIFLNIFLKTFTKALHHFPGYIRRNEKKNSVLISMKIPKEKYVQTSPSVI